MRWEHIDFNTGVMSIQQGVVNGRIVKVKAEASQDEVPLDPAFAAVLNDWRGDRTEGLVSCADGDEARATACNCSLILNVGICGVRGLMRFH